MNELLFYFACIPFRVLLGFFITTFYYRDSVHIVGTIVAIVIATGFIRKILTRPKTGFFGGVVWWQRLRYMHVVVWYTVAALIFNKIPWAGWVIVLDAIPGFFLKAQQ